MNETIKEKNKNKTIKRNYKLSVVDKKKILYLYATGQYSLRELGRRFGVQNSSIWSIIHSHPQAFERYKKEAQKDLQREFIKFAKEALKVAEKKKDKMSAYQALTAAAIAYDKAWPKSGVVIDRRNQKIKIVYSRWKEKQT